VQSQSARRPDGSTAVPDSWLEVAANDHEPEGVREGSGRDSNPRSGYARAVAHFVLAVAGTDQLPDDITTGPLDHIVFSMIAFKSYTNSFCTCPFRRRNATLKSRARIRDEQVNYAFRRQHRQSISHFVFGDDELA
jgi:hypothetical protein